MGEQTAISWTDKTFQPWEGCARVSPGCTNCYAEERDRRWHGGEHWGKDAPRKPMSEAYWRGPIKWNAEALASGEPCRVFCASLADVFEDRPDLMLWRSRLFGTILSTPALTWQLLTKRPENVRAMVPGRWLDGYWPHNVWIGTTCEDQQRTDERLPHMAKIPAPVRFLSCEPLLGEIDLLNHIEPCDMGPSWWLICGGESGPNYRPMNLDHARSLRQQCITWDIPFWFKQHGGKTPTAGGHLLDGVEYHQFPSVSVAPS